MMDLRLIILGLSVALVVISFAVLINAAIKAFRSKSPDDVFAAQGYFHDSGDAATLDHPVDPLECPFEEAEETAADWLSEPIRAGSWNPDVRDVPVPVVALEPLHSPVVAFEPEPAPAFEPEPAPAFEPEPAPAFEPEPAPAFEPELAPAFEPELAPAFEPELAPAFEPEPAPAFEPEPAPAFEPEPAPDRGEFVPVAPIEMWFGEARVGVKEGSRTYSLLTGYAQTLLDDLRRARQGA